MVDNRPGADGNLGVNIVAKSPADGYTLGFATNGPLAVNVTLFSKMPYDPATDLTPISHLAFGPNILAVNPSLGVKDLDGLIRLFKANPGKYVISSGGNGTTQHLAVEMLKKAAHVEITHVPYEGGGPTLIDIVGNQVPITFCSVPACMPHICAASLIPLAVTSPQRSPALRDVPTIAEKGFPG